MRRQPEPLRQRTMTAIRLASAIPLPSASSTSATFQYRSKPRRAGMPFHVPSSGSASSASA